MTVSFGKEEELPCGHVLSRLGYHCNDCVASLRERAERAERERDAACEDSRRDRERVARLVEGSASLRSALEGLMLAVERVAFLMKWKDEASAGGGSWMTNLPPDVELLIQAHDRALALASRVPPGGKGGAGTPGSGT